MALSSGNSAQKVYFSLKNNYSFERLTRDRLLLKCFALPYHQKLFSTSNDDTNDENAPKGNKKKTTNKSKASKKVSTIVSNLKLDSTSLKSLADKKFEATNKLSSLLLDLKVDQTSSNTKKHKPLNLAKPGGAKAYKEQQKREKPPVKVEITQEHLENQIKAAVSDVAATLGGDVKKTESELLLKLKGHIRKEKPDDETPNLGNLFVGMKIDRTKQKSIINTSSARNAYAEFQPQYSGQLMPDFTEGKSRMLTKPVDVPYKKINLYANKPLGYFQKGAQEESKTLWQKFDEEELGLLITQPPNNAFEEMIMWTEQGKLWQFPIDNEFGLDEEAKVGFEEHVFLEEHLEGFPTKGPIRHFMELVVIGLSKNPYISVERKKENIEWYRQYFQGKEALLKEMGVLDATQLKASEQSANSS